MVTITNRNGTLYESVTVMIPHMVKCKARERGLSLSAVLTKALEDRIEEGAGNDCISCKDASQMR